MVLMMSKRRLKTLCFVALSIVVILICSFGVRGKAVATAAKARIVPIYRVDRDDKAVSITIDATWGDEQTGAILDLLDKENVKTTFFLAGNWLKTCSEMVKEIARRGHEIGNHSLTHPKMSELSKESIIKELKENEEMIKALTGSSSKNFRPPFGDYNNLLIETAKECGYNTIQWSIDSLDWKEISAEDILDRVKSKLKSGDIILFHNAGKHTLKALEITIAYLKSEGYSILPVKDILLTGDTYTDGATGEQKLVK